ncbi:hypothetical protein [Psychrobacter sp. M13]|uniref:hypothetical protein n=1 Tax=Psychrobacter sp. M13 TaxID=3067275 RepID=UPI00273C333B|nr:hypothetical protein [Psychrobacter sp. M13]WLP95655.1 hypothetical protein Q9G97_06040 [Psychrobacter sp. M13]
MNTVKIEFGVPVDGWLELTISNQSQCIILDISDVSCDSISELAKAVINLQLGSKTEEVEFSLEPDFALWRFISFTDELQIQVFPNSSCGKPFIFKGTREEVLDNLYEALKDFETESFRQSPDDMMHVWSWDFPSTTLNKYSRRRVLSSAPIMTLLPTIGAWNAPYKR